jgi:molybdate transport system ATP-binding protein
MLSKCHVERFWDRRIRDLSSGEMRRVQIGLALAASPRVLILDEPFEALDAESRNELADLIQGLMDRERSVVMVTHRRQEILPNITHVMGVKDGHVVFQGPRETLLNTEAMDALYAQPAPFFDDLPDGMSPRGFASKARRATLIDLQNIRVAYSGVAVFENLSWTVREGEHWVVSGPNGSGKTTLLRLIVGDHPQAYANTVRVLGQRRGSGSIIRELKKEIGLVSSELQVRYVKNVTVLEAVISGFFASVGLYRHPGRQQTTAADRWLDFLGIQHLAGQPFKHLSQGEQRLVLLARALVTSPRLLVLDEPCQGLDRTNRRMILSILDRIAKADATTILYVTHHPEEIPACILRRLSLVRSGAGAFRAVCSMV